LVIRPQNAINTDYFVALTIVVITVVTCRAVIEVTALFAITITAYIVTRAVIIVVYTIPTITALTSDAI
jgi:hypothetical protein